MLDCTFLGVDAGCEALARAVAEKRHRWHFFGHIHEAYGLHRGEYTTSVNCSYAGGGPPLVLDVPAAGWAEAGVVSPAGSA